MLPAHISMEQLIQVINGLDEVEKIQLKSVLESDIIISEETLDELNRRKEQFLKKNITAQSWEEVRDKYGRI